MPLNSAKRKKRLHVLEKLENVEIEQHEDFLNIEESERFSETEVVDYIELSEDDIKINLVPFVYRGLIAPVFTPFNNDPARTLNLQIIPAYAEHLVNSGISGVLVGGTTGEGTSMTVEERKLVTEVWAQVCAQTQQHLMVQVGGAPLPDVLELAQHAEQKAVNSLLCLPELYHKPTTTADLIRYMQIVAQAAPNTPLFYYHIPSMTNVNINMGAFLREIGDKIPTFCGIKFTSTTLDEGLSAVKANDGKFAVFLGADSIMAGAYALGFDSAIATTFNMFAQHGQQILQAIKDGNVSEGQTTQDELNSAINIITKNGTWVPTMKEAMNLLTPINVGPIRDPLVALTPEQVKQLETEMKELKFLS